MPAKGTTKVSEQQRALVAKRRIQGATNTQIAAETGLHTATVSDVWNSPEAQMIVARARYECAPLIRKIQEKIFSTLLEDLEAAKTLKERTQLREEAATIISRGEPVAAQAAANSEGQGEYTLQELLLRVSRATIPAGTTGVSYSPPSSPPTLPAGNGNGHNGNGHHG